MLSIVVGRIIIMFLTLVVVGCSSHNIKEVVSNNDALIKPESKEGTVNYTAGNWHFIKESNKCFIYSFPISSSGFYLNRKANYIMINSSKHIVVFGGLNYKVDSIVTLDVSGSKFLFNTISSKAWYNYPGDDLINALLKHPNSAFLVHNEFAYTTSDKEHTYSIDKYSADGFLELWNKLQQSCGNTALQKENIS